MDQLADWMWQTDSVPQMTLIVHGMVSHVSLHGMQRGNFSEMWNTHVEVFSVVHKFSWDHRQSKLFGKDMNACIMCTPASHLLLHSTFCFQNGTIFACTATSKRENHLQTNQFHCIQTFGHIQGQVLFGNKVNCFSSHEFRHHLHVNSPFVNCFIVKRVSFVIPAPK